MNKKGFTLVELLVAIGTSIMILSVGIIAVNETIKKAEDKKTTIAHENIKKSANLYSKEFSDKLIWINVNDADNCDKGECISRSCITIEELIAKGYIEKDKVKDATDEYVIIEKNQNGIILSETNSKGFDSSLNEDIDICNTSIKRKVSTPTSKNICKRALEYNGTEQNLIKETIDAYYQVESISPTSTKKANSYEVKISLKEGYTWKDNTNESKIVHCTIKKADPSIELESNPSEENYKNQTITIKLTSNIRGTIELKSSNPKYATASFKEGNGELVENGSKYTKEIIINNLAKRQTNTYITITFKPEDSKNYNIISRIYSLGNIDSLLVNKPTDPSSFCNKNLYYDGTEKILTTTEGGDGYSFINNTATAIGRHDVIIRLDQGLKWSDGQTNDINFQCGIKAPTYTIQYLGNDNTGGYTENSTHTYDEGKTLTTNGFTKTGYVFKEWNTKADGTGISYKNNETVLNLSKTNNDVITLYAQWELDQGDAMDTPNGTYYCTEKTTSMVIFMDEKKDLSGIMSSLSNMNMLANNVPFCFNQNEVIDLVKGDCSSFLSSWPFASAYVHKSYISDINKVKSENIYGDYVFGYIPLQNMGTCLTTLGCPGIDQFKQRWCS